MLKPRQIQTERERERERHVYVYIYIEERERVPGRETTILFSPQDAMTAYKTGDAAGFGSKLGSVGASLAAAACGYVLCVHVCLCVGFVDS